jgi:hypothetical protein
VALAATGEGLAGGDLAQASINKKDTTSNAVQKYGERFIYVVTFREIPS